VIDVRHILERRINCGGIANVPYVQCDFGVQVRGAMVALTVNLPDQRVERANAITRGEQTIGTARAIEPLKL
jgi:hypothetical protein